jgi:hypothetical protein
MISFVTCTVSRVPQRNVILTVSSQKIQVQISGQCRLQLPFQSRREGDKALERESGKRGQQRGKERGEELLGKKVGRREEGRERLLEGGSGSDGVRHQALETALAMTASKGQHRLLRARCDV